MKTDRSLWTFSAALVYFNRYILMLHVREQKKCDRYLNVNL